MHKLICHNILKKYQSFLVFCQQGKKKVVCQHSLNGSPFTDGKQPPVFFVMLILAFFTALGPCVVYHFIASQIQTHP